MYLPGDVTDQPYGGETTDVRWKEWF